MHYAELRLYIHMLFSGFLKNQPVWLEMTIMSNYLY